MVRAEHRDYERLFNAKISIDDYVRLFWERSQGAPHKTPKAMDDAFMSPRNDAERKIRDLISAHREQEAHRLQQELFAQSKRLADAQRKQQAKVTNSASESARIAADKIARAKTRLADLERTAAKEGDARIYPGVYAPVLVVEDGERVIKPMRYQCRPCGKPAAYDRKYPGTYNARRDNLEGFWRGQFGLTHGIVLATAFYEHVARHAVEGRELREGEVEESIVLEFRPRPRHDMLVACLWSKWSAPGEPDLLSFAAITDDPPPEVAAAGHDRCIIPIKPENLDDWLRPSNRLDDQYAILDDRDRPFYEHRMAA
jgi:putative SOS response-associated peptidase YedK